jgi:hypothetical protein
MALGRMDLARTLEEPNSVRRSSVCSCNSSAVRAYVHRGDVRHRFRLLHTGRRISLHLPLLY